MLEISQNPGESGITPNTLYTPPKFPQLWIYFLIKKCQIIFRKGVYRTPPENVLKTWGKSGVTPNTHYTPPKFPQL
jgi:hypothetical protein